MFFFGFFSCFLSFRKNVQERKNTEGREKERGIEKEKDRENAIDWKMGKIYLFISRSEYKLKFLFRISIIKRWLGFYCLNAEHFLTSSNHWIILIDKNKTVETLNVHFKSVDTECEEIYGVPVINNDRCQMYLWLCNALRTRINSTPKIDSFEKMLYFWWTDWNNQVHYRIHKEKENNSKNEAAMQHRTTFQAFSEVKNENLNAKKLNCSYVVSTYF